MKPRKADIYSPTNDVTVMICAYNEQEMMPKKWYIKIISENEGVCLLTCSLVFVLLCFLLLENDRKSSSVTWEIHSLFVLEFPLISLLKNGGLTELKSKDLEKV